MSTIKCSGIIIESAQGYAKCNTGWEVVADVVTIADLTSSEVQEIGTAVVFMFVLAFVFRHIYKFVNSGNPGRG